jgi:hypothetical protein
MHQLVQPKRTDKDLILQQYSVTGLYGIHHFASTETEFNKESHFSDANGELVFYVSFASPSGVVRILGNNIGVSCPYTLLRRAFGAKWRKCGVLLPYVAERFRDAQCHEK